MKGRFFRRQPLAQLLVRPALAWVSLFYERALSSDYRNCDHRSGAWILERLYDEECDRRAWEEACRGRRRLLLLAMASWLFAGALVALLFTS